MSRSNHSTYHTTPANVGIRAIELYYPRLYVDQNELELFDQTSPGKYTIGLGQVQMGVASDLEDVNSVCLTVTRRLLKRYKINMHQLGRIEVGTESQIDKSKSVKSNLMRLLVDEIDDDQLIDCEGADTINACFGGTQALFNAINWVESTSCMGRLALVVMGDVAVYAPGPARPTGGAGALALIIGPDAPLVFDRGYRVTAMQHAYDFYKPSALNSEYALFDGPSSVRSYSRCLDQCYLRYKQRADTLSGLSSSIDSFNALLFHSPYCKLVEKSLARLRFHDLRQAKIVHNNNMNGALDIKPYLCMPLEDTYDNKELERALVKYNQSVFNKYTAPSLMFAKRIGNMYTPSLYSGILSLLSQSTSPNELYGHKYLLFSYGSGSCSAMFSLTVRNDMDNNSDEYGQLEQMIDTSRTTVNRLDERRKISPELFTDMLKQRELLVNGWCTIRET